MPYYMVETFSKNHVRNREVLRAKNIQNLRIRLIKETSWDNLYKGNLSTKGYADGVITLFPVKGPNADELAKGKVPEDLFRTVGKDGQVTYWVGKFYNNGNYAYKVSEKTGNLSKTVKRKW